MTPDGRPEDGRFKSVNAECWVSAGGGGSAIACVELRGDVDGLLAALGARSVATGDVCLRRVRVRNEGPGATDEAVVARWSDRRATVMLHGGTAVVRGFISCVISVGGQEVDAGGFSSGASADGVFIECAGDVERAAMESLWRAASPAAIDLLLAQARRWRDHRREQEDEHRDAVLRRLIEPALVVAVGPANVGKSSLLNALAKSAVSIVADVPGTTRDHVGTLLDLGGVVVRWVDTPGFGSGTHLERGDDALSRAKRLAWDVATMADVLVVCRDAEHPAPEVVERLAAKVAGRRTGVAGETGGSDGSVVRLGLRSDLGRSPGVDANVGLSLAGEGSELGGVMEGLEGAVSLIRERVVPARWLNDGLPWRFWSDLGVGG